MPESRLYSEVVAEIARQVCYARGRENPVTINGIEFDPETGGWCARFVRKCYAAAMRTIHPTYDEQAFSWASPNAHSLRLRLQTAAGLPKSEVEELPIEKAPPGSIVAFVHSKPPGHAAIYLGGGVIAENTSSTKRGPGTVISRLAAVEGPCTFFQLLDSRPAVPEWARDAWGWATREGLIDGTEPLDQATRAEVVTMLHRYHLAKGE